MNNFDEYNESTTPSQRNNPNRMPWILGIAGVAFGALSFGFVAANAFGIGGQASPASTIEATPTSHAVVRPPGEGIDATPDATQPPATPATTTPVTSTPSPTPVPPTATPTQPAINSPKFHHIFRAEGGTASTNGTTALPVRRVEAFWNNSYQNCPSATCIRGRASVTAGVGPFGTAETPVASASVFNTFVAQRADANLLMDLRWSGTLLTLAGANATTGVKIEVIVSEIDRDTSKVIGVVPGMPYSVLSEEIGLGAIQGYDSIKLEESRSINIPLKLKPNSIYRIDLKITCSTRVAFSLSATTCGFSGGSAGVEWTKQVIEFDTGICSPNERGTGCIYRP